MLEKINAYIDESGDPRFNEGASSHLEFTAILVEDNIEGALNTQLIEIKKRLKINEFKSQKIRHESRRISILETICTLDFKYISLSIKKDKIFGVWKTNPKVFYKYSQKILHSELYRLFPDRTVTIDKFGTEEYQTSLKVYLERNNQFELFDNTVNIGSAKNEILIQIADFIAGTSRKLAIGDFQESQKISELLNKIKLHQLIWPDNFQRYNIDLIKNDKDKTIAEISTSYADRYITSYSKSLNHKSKVLVLEYLLFQVRFNNPHEYIYSQELIDWLGQNNIELTEEEFRKDVIGQLRDDGVVIAGSRKGLKIPMSALELSEYLNYTSSRYLTMIRRFKETYNTLNASSFGKIGIFNGEEFNMHKEIFDILEKY